MRCIMERFDSLENNIKNGMTKPPEKERRTYNGELLLDNTDLCQMLNVSKRTLQRYRTLKWLKYRQLDQKIYYLESDVDKFIKERFEKKRTKVSKKTRTKNDCFS
jgi:hypothetical protein